MSSTSCVDPFLVNGAIDGSQILRDWNETTFRAAVTFYRRDPTSAKPLFSDYAWEIYDRVLEYALSTSTALVAEVDLLDCVQLIAAHSRPREMFLMVTEKAIHAVTGVADSMTCFSSSKISCLRAKDRAFNSSSFVFTSVNKDLFLSTSLSFSIHS